MSGYARVFPCPEAVYVRFENAGSRSKFDPLRDRFNQCFRLKHWDDKRRAWQLPLAELSSLVSFCQATFGPNGCVLEDSTHHPQSQDANSMGYSHVDGSAPL